MTIIRLAGFSGENRATHPILLPETVGTTSLNQKPGRGDLRPWKTPSTVATVPSGRKTIYRVGRDTADNSAYWASWTGVVHAVRGFDPDDTTERTYYTGDGVPKITNNTNLDGVDPQVNPGAWVRHLGVPAPTTGPTVSDIITPNLNVTTVNTVASTQTYDGYSYLSTVTPHGYAVGGTMTWEGPSGNTGAFAVFSVVDADTVSVVTPGTVSAPEVTDFAGYKLTYSPPEGEVADTETRFYCYTYVSDVGWESAPSPPSTQVDCVVGSNATIGGFAAPPSVGNLSIVKIRVYRTQAGASGSADFYLMQELAYPGTASDVGQTLGEVLPTTTWLTPPEDLSSLTSLWNGMLAGITGTSVRFCEAYVPYAWPIAYDVVPPDAKPVALGVYGQNLLVLTTGRPLLVTGTSPDSMDQQPIDMHQGCIASRSVVSMGYGVIWASMDGLMMYGSGGAKMLTAGLMTRDDWQAITPSSIVGKMYEGMYFGSYESGSGRKGFFIDPANPTGIYFLETGYEGLHYDELLDQLFVLDGTSVKRWDAGTDMTYTFKSKLYRMPQPTRAFSCAQVIADGAVTFKLYADGVLKHTQAVTNTEAFRLPAGYHCNTVQLELIGSSPVQGVVMAHSMKELSTT